MHIGNKLFPYPILNSNQVLSDYNKDINFCFHFDKDENNEFIVKNNKIVLKNLCFELNDCALKQLMKEGKANACFVVEGSSAVYRKIFPITDMPHDLTLSLNDLTGEIHLSCFVYAATDISGFNSPNFLEVYEDLSFDLDKYDILAADDGLKFVVEENIKDDDMIESIFTVVRADNDDGLLKYTDNDRKIVLQLPSSIYVKYSAIKDNSKFEDLMFAIQAIPVLAACIQDVQGRHESIDEIVDNKVWFRSVVGAYLRSTNKVLDYDTLHRVSALEIAQQVLKKATCAAISEVEQWAIRGDGSSEEGDDADD